MEFELVLKIKLLYGIIILYRHAVIAKFAMGIIVLMIIQIILSLDIAKSFFFYSTMSLS